jgi:RNA polymerase sigma-70 factor (ECF subfamily)
MRPVLQLRPGCAAEDRGLVRAEELGTPLSLDEAFRRYASYVAAVATRLLGRDDEVNDVVQDVFVAALTGLGTLREPAAVKAWLATLTVRTAGRKLRLRRLKSFIGIDDGDGYLDLASDEASPEERALLGRVYALLDEMPVSRRVAWTLRYVEGHDLEAVARLCNCSLATAKRRIAAAHETLDKVVNRG